jgi:hypothetical protein
MRSSRSEVETPGVRRVGINFPVWIGLKKKKTMYGWDGDKTHTLAFHVLVDIVMANTGVRFFVMRYIVDLVLLEKRVV